MARDANSDCWKPPAELTILDPSVVGQVSDLPPATYQETRCVAPLLAN